MIRNLGIGTGRRKCAVARVFLREGEGKVSVNGQELDKYFKLSELVTIVRQPLLVTASENKYDILITVAGGGPNGTDFTFGQLIGRDPIAPLEFAIRGMLPKGPLGRKLYKNAKIYAGPKHPHAAQAPVAIEIE